QSGEDEDTHNHAGDLTDTTGEGNTTNDTGRDSVHFPALAISSRTGTNHADAFQPGAEAIEDTSQNEGADSDAEYGDTGNSSSFRVGANGKQVLTEGGLVPDEPDDDNRCNRPQDDGGEATDLGDDHAGNGGFNSTEGNALGGVCNQTKDNQHVSHGRNERVHFELGREETCDGREDG